ncbi:MAG: AMP-binding protein [Desulfurivibrionaceae bacterium]|nr:AMP-binding protein [Desulfurivibrionaceae bacterium]
MTQRYTLAHGQALRRAEAPAREEVQLALLQAHLQQAGRMPFYGQRFKELGFYPEELRSLSELAGLPLTSRRDLDEGCASFSREEQSSFADIALTSGTTGEPVVVPYTDLDLQRLAYNEMMAFYGAGVRGNDRVLLTVTLDRCFIAGLAYYSGLVRLGATVIRSGAGQPARQWHLIKTLQPRFLVGVPTFLLNLAQWGAANGMHPREAGIAGIITIGEPTRRADFSLTPLGERLSESWGAPLCSSYGATELETAFGECAQRRGGHVHPELMLVEIVDEEGRRLPAGEPGEVVVTPLGVEGMPLVRFQTGDVARLHEAPCPCGWQTPRLGPIEGRLAQRLKYRGTTLYPEMIFHALQEIHAVQAAYVEVRAGFDLADEVTVVVGGEVRPAQVLELLQAKLRVRPALVIKSRQEVVTDMEQGGGHKPRKFFDYR